MPAWRDAYFTVTPANRVGDSSLAKAGNAPGSFDAYVEVYDTAQDNGRVRVKSTATGPKDFVAQLNFNGTVKDTCTFQSFHLTASPGIDVQNAHDPSHAAPLDLAATHTAPERAASGGQLPDTRLRPLSQQLR